MSKFQLPSPKRGLDVPNIRWYQLASQLKNPTWWIKDDRTSVWLDLEKSQISVFLLGLLFCKDFKSVKSLCNNNPIIFNTLKAWFMVRELEGRCNLTSQLIHIQGNPGFQPGI